MPLQESTVGILRHANTTPGFSAILKQRFTDFQVFEVGRDGGVARLTERLYKAPEAMHSSNSSFLQPSNKRRRLDGVAAEPQGAVEQPPQDTVSAPELECELARFRELAGSEDELKLRTFMLAVAAHEAAPKDVSPPEALVLTPSESKEHRRDVHNFFKQALFASLSTETLVDRANKAATDTPVSIIVSHKAMRTGSSRGNALGKRGRWPDEWPGNSNRFLRFSLYKENMDTQAAVSLLGRYLHLGWSSFGVAGSKDKRGATVQNVTLFKVHPARLSNLNPRLRGLQTGNFSFVPHELHLGDLSGNIFDIILRDVQGEPGAVAAAADALRASGFINYFGLQRFGNEATPTHALGCLLLKGEWQAAVHFIMKHRPGEKPPLVDARQQFLEGNLRASMDLIPSYAAAEKAVLQVLCQQGGDQPVAALQSIPKNLRLMYLHAVQSLLWNLAASDRISRYGIDKVVAGDLVIPQDAQSTEPVGDPSQERDPSSFHRMQNVCTVTEEDLAARRYSIEDVALPLPGTDVIYPSHETAQVYEEEAARLGVSLHQCSHGVQEFAITSLPGDYRKLVHRPSNLEWNLLVYEAANQDLGYTDLDKLLEKPAPSCRDISPDEVVPDGHFVALRLRFRLPPSSYATMLIRELMKDSTATAEHRARTLAGLKPAAD